MQACVGQRMRCVSATPGRTRQQLCWTSRSACRHRSALIVQAKDRTTGNAALDTVISAGQGFVESASNMVPENVPRPVAKTGVAVATGLVAFWVLQKLVSTVLTIALLGGAAWFYFQYAGGSGDGGSSGSGGGASSSSKRAVDGDLDDPLSEARRIMDKYKK
uniref:Uncharacterized protein n=1 Tax=Tetradesmus obliquus TaxID=3088 RepID=A0A383W2U3_TETOB|eukprot:jgi/Sobl393_1/4705/SZX71530.1